MTCPRVPVSRPRPMRMFCLPIRKWRRSSMFRVFEMFRMCDSPLVLITWLWALCIVQGSTLRSSHQVLLRGRSRAQSWGHSKSNEAIRIHLVFIGMWSFNTYFTPVLLAYQYVSCRILEENNFSFCQRKSQTSIVLFSFWMPDFMFVLHS